ncbi:MAG: hypothetical protein LBG48_03220, partial [Rickettsiales bacterium]|nr:hypothetical protein [Rickettsiales bacterium]
MTTVKEKDSENQNPCFYNTEAEQIILGKLLENAGWYLDRMNVKGGYFYEEAHRRIFDYIAKTYRNNKISPDSVVCKNFFDSDEILKQIGGSNYIGILLSVSTGIFDVLSYAKLIQDLYFKRQFKELLVETWKETKNLQIDSET